MTRAQPGGAVAESPASTVPPSVTATGPSTTAEASPKSASKSFPQPWSSHALDAHAATDTNATRRPKRCMKRTIACSGSLAGCARVGMLVRVRARALTIARRTIAARALATVLALSITASTTRASADVPDASESTLEEARASLKEGTAKLYAGNPAEALVLLVRSYALFPSPNTELLLGRAQRELGRRVEAVASLEHAAAEASRRAAKGEAKYAPTATAARDEALALRAKLGVIELHLADPRGASVVVDGKPVTFASAADVVLLHEPGRAEISVQSGGAEQRQIVTVLAGSTLRLEFGGGASRPAAVAPMPAARAPADMGPPPPAGAATPWTTPAAWTAAAVTAAGLGTFAFFGLRSASTYDDLAERCGPTCGAADRAEADRGERDQTIANVGLAVAAAAAVSLVLFVVLAPSRGGGTSSAPRVARSGIDLLLGPGL